MTSDKQNNISNRILVAIDVAKYKHDVLVQWPNGTRKKLKVANTLENYTMLLTYLASDKKAALVGLEATGNYHRTLAYYLQNNGIEVCLVSSLAMAKTRDAMYNSWDKNDPKDAQVILHLLKTGLKQIYYDPLLNNNNDIQELSNTYQQVSLRKVRVQHSIFNHYLPLYFPEVEKYFHSSRALWFSSVLLRFPCPSAVIKYSEEQFIEEAWKIVGRKVDKTNWLKDFYQTARGSIGLPIAENSTAIEMFKIILKEHQDLCRLRLALEQQSMRYLESKSDYKHLNSMPGVGPIIALTILAEAGDLRRFKHYKQFLKYCGFDLSTQQSGCFRGESKLSKRGNAALRKSFWLAATVAIRKRENTFRKKFESYIKNDPNNDDVKRKAYTAVAAKMARVAYGLIKHEADYLCYYETKQ